jgi:hypothetical protein
MPMVMAGTSRKVSISVGRKTREMQGFSAMIGFKSVTQALAHIVLIGLEED